MGKEYCEFCDGRTYDDKRGNCMACGAPRKHSNIVGAEVTQAFVIESLSTASISCQVVDYYDMQVWQDGRWRAYP